MLIVLLISQNGKDLAWKRDSHSHSHSEFQYTLRKHQMKRLHLLTNARQTFYFGEVYLSAIKFGPKCWIRHKYLSNFIKTVLGVMEKRLSIVLELVFSLLFFFIFLHSHWTLSKQKNNFLLDVKTIYKQKHILVKFVSPFFFKNWTERNRNVSYWNNRNVKKNVKRNEKRSTRKIGKLWVNI